MYIIIVIVLTLAWAVHDKASTAEAYKKRPACIWFSADLTICKHGVPA